VALEALVFTLEAQVVMQTTLTVHQAVAVVAVVFLPLVAMVVSQAMALLAVKVALEAVEAVAVAVLQPLMKTN
jgi:hypothetical protein